MIEDGRTVKIHYTLTVDGKTVSTSRESDPLEYEHGKGHLIPGLEKELAGMKTGERKRVTVGPAEAYGPYNPEAVIEVPRADIESEDLREGMVLKGTDSQGHTLQGVVKQILNETVFIDFNHPLAGKELTFEVEVVSID